MQGPGSHSLSAKWQIGKFIGSYGYTAKGHQCQAAFRPMDGPWKLIILTGLACNAPIQLRGLLHLLKAARTR